MPEETRMELAENMVDNSITVILPVTNEIQASLDEQLIINELSSGLILSSSELAMRTGFSRDKVIRLINRLNEKHYVTVHGTGRGTRYSKA